MTVLALSAGEWIGVAGVSVGVVALAIAYRTLRAASAALDYATTQIVGMRRATDAAIAAEVRALNGECRSEKHRVINTFPLHESFLERYPRDRWEIVVAGERLGAEDAKEVVDWLERQSHPATATWKRPTELSDEQRSDARAVVGFLNDLCQMLSDGTPGHFIFQQYHQMILTQGPLVVPLVYEAQSGGRWGVRLPWLVRLAATYHDVRKIHGATTIKIRRAIDLDGLGKPPAALHGSGKAELLIPIVGGKTPWVRYEDVPNRPIEQPQEEEFKDHFTGWKPPGMFLE